LQIQLDPQENLEVPSLKKKKKKKYVKSLSFLIEERGMDLKKKPFARVTIFL
jgi:hypothetical protein